MRELNSDYSNLKIFLDEDRSNNELRYSFETGICEIYGKDQAGIDRCIESAEASGYLMQNCDALKIMRDCPQCFDVLQAYMKVPEERRAEAFSKAMQILGKEYRVEDGNIVVQAVQEPESASAAET